MQSAKHSKYRFIGSNDHKTSTEIMSSKSPDTIKLRVHVISTLRVSELYCRDAKLVFYISSEIFHETWDSSVT